MSALLTGIVPSGATTFPCSHPTTGGRGDALASFEVSNVPPPPSPPLVPPLELPLPEPFGSSNPCFDEPHATSEAPVRKAKAARETITLRIMGSAIWPAIRAGAREFHHARRRRDGFVARGR